MDSRIISFSLNWLMQFKQFYNIATKVSSRKKCYYFWWSTWLISEMRATIYSNACYCDMHAHPKDANSVLVFVHLTKSFWIANWSMNELSVCNGFCSNADFPYVIYHRHILWNIKALQLDSGPLFTKQTDVLPQVLVKTWGHEIRI